jgi:hypothetical protein
MNPVVEVVLGRVLFIGFLILIAILGDKLGRK